MPWFVIARRNNTMLECATRRRIDAVPDCMRAVAPGGDRDSTQRDRGVSMDAGDCRAILRGAGSMRRPTKRATTTERPPLTALVALALVIAGCPMATGRQRGPLDSDGGVCAVTSIPSTGEACSIDAISCDFNVPCDDGGTSPNDRSIERCACSGGRWRCSQLACEEYLPDGRLACPRPGTPQAQTFVCDARLAGRTCPINPRRCSTRTTPTAECTCDGTYWQCPALVCPEPPEPPPPPPPPPPPLRNPSGRFCGNDDQCDGLRCDKSRTRIGICTARCTPGAAEDVLFTQCSGLDARCTESEANPGEGYCSNPCMALEDCTGDTVCGALHLNGALNACVPFCRFDASCPEGIRCRIASGQCSNRSDAPMLLPHGSPCVEDSARPFQCEGRCVRVTTTAGSSMRCVGVQLGGTCPTINGRAQLERRVGSLTYCLGSIECSSRIPCCPGRSVCERRPELDAFACGDDTPMPNVACGSDSGVSMDAGD